MARADQGDEALRLFDLPLEPPAAPRREPPPEPPPATRPAVAEEEPAPLPLVAPGEAEGAAPAAPGAAESGDPSAAPRPAPVGERLLAGLADLGVLAAVGAAGALGSGWLGAPLTAATWPAAALFVLVFSFLYAVVPLAFWGRTPGMAWRRLTARGEGGQPLTFGQAGRRWLGGLITALLFGLPLLLALGGRSLADRLSGSATWREPPPAG